MYLHGTFSAAPWPGLSILVSRVGLVAAWPAVPVAVLPTPALPVGTSPRRRRRAAAREKLLPLEVTARLPVGASLGKFCNEWHS